MTAAPQGPMATLQGVTKRFGTLAAVQTLRWVQGQFPVFRDKGVTDSHPLMKPTIGDLP